MLNSTLWYQSQKIQKLLLNECIKKEIRFGFAKHLNRGQALSPFYKVDSMEQLNLRITNYGLCTTNNYNVFTSLATYKNINFDNMEYWLKNHWRHFDNYPFFLDIDIPSMKDIGYAIESVQYLLTLFNKINLQYQLRFSGRGFHILIDQSNFPKVSQDPKQKMNIYKLYEKIMRGLKEDYTDMIDHRNRFDSFRKIKMPYSLSCYEDDEKFCCVPIRPESLENFGLQKFKPEIVINNLKYYQEYYCNTGDSLPLVKIYAEDYLDEN